MEFKAHAYQKKIIESMLDNKKLLAVVDMGLGKTVCTLTAIEELMYNCFEIKKALVIAPLKVIENTWPQELKKWDHLHHLRVQPIMDKNPSARILQISSDADIYLINREKLEWLITSCVAMKHWDFDCIVIDESSMFKNHATKSFKALKVATKNALRVYELTGTPTPNGAADLWSQVYALDQGERLGNNITAFRNRWFIRGKTPYTEFGWRPRLDAEKEIWDKVTDVSISMQAQDYLKMPERVDNIITLEMPKKISKIYKTLEREQILKLRRCTEELEANKKQITVLSDKLKAAELNNNIQQIAQFKIEMDKLVSHKIEASNKAVVLNKLLQFTSGAVYEDDHKVVNIHDLKIEALTEIIKSNENKPILVFYNYKHERERLLQTFKKLKPREIKTSEDIEDWNRGDIKILLAHPASAGHGLNLQAGGNIIVWFSLTWSLELYQQANARLHRQGQKRTVIINHLLLDGTVDKQVMQALRSKKLTQDSLIKAIELRMDEEGLR